MSDGHEPIGETLGGHGEDHPSLLLQGLTTVQAFGLGVAPTPCWISFLAETSEMEAAHYTATLPLTFSDILT